MNPSVQKGPFRFVWVIPLAWFCLAWFCLASCNSNRPVAPPVEVPNDAQPLCAVSPADINGWFRSGSSTLNGIVNPPHPRALTAL